MMDIPHFRVLLPPIIALIVAAAACGVDSTGGGSAGGGTGGSGSGSGSGGSGSGGSGSGGSGTGAGGSGSALVCIPGSVERCYDGPEGTEQIGICAAGQRTCVDDGSGYGPCEGSVTPGEEDCATAADDDCDGQENETEAGCLCAPGSTKSCYSGPNGTQGVGACFAGQKICDADGKSYGSCIGEVVPAPESCTTPLDDDCDGLVNEEGSDCACAPGTSASCYSGLPGTEGVGPCIGGTQQCNAEGTGYGPCTGEVTPVPEKCTTPGDDDCDGRVNEEGTGCVCVPSSAAPCYSGPAGSQDVGVCHAGAQTCNTLGTAYGACTGEVTPAEETCDTAVDDDCDGQINEEGTGCVSGGEGGGSGGAAGAGGSGAGGGSDTGGTGGSGGAAGGGGGPTFTCPSTKPDNSASCSPDWPPYILCFYLTQDTCPCPCEPGARHHWRCDCEGGHWLCGDPWVDWDICYEPMDCCP